MSLCVKWMPTHIDFNILQINIYAQRIMLISTYVYLCDTLRTSFYQTKAQILFEIHVFQRQSNLRPLQNTFSRKILINSAKKMCYVIHCEHKLAYIYISIYLFIYIQRKCRNTLLLLVPQKNFKWFRGRRMADLGETNRQVCI